MTEEQKRYKRELARWSQIGQLGGLIYLENLKRETSWSPRELAVKSLNMAEVFVDEWFKLEPGEKSS